MKNQAVICPAPLRLSAPHPRQAESVPGGAALHTQGSPARSTVPAHRAGQGGADTSCSPEGASLGEAGRVRRAQLGGTKARAAAALLWDPAL